MGSVSDNGDVATSSSAAGDDPELAELLMVVRGSNSQEVPLEVGAVVGQ